MKIIWIASSNSRKTLSLSKKLIQDIGLCQKADVLLSDWVGCSDEIITTEKNFMEEFMRNY